MARGEHPQRTPFYGALLLMGAYLACWLASSMHTLWQSVAIYIVAAIAAGTGVIVTFRDYDFPRRRR